MINVRPSRIGLLPCLLIVLLWFVLPPPELLKSPDLDPETREAALRALQATQTHYRKTRINGRKRVLLGHDDLMVDGDTAGGGGEKGHLDLSHHLDRHSSDQGNEPRMRNVIGGSHSCYRCRRCHSLPLLPHPLTHSPPLLPHPLTQPFLI